MRRRYVEANEEIKVNLQEAKQQPGAREGPSTWKARKKTSKLC